MEWSLNLNTYHLETFVINFKLNCRNEVFPTALYTINIMDINVITSVSRFFILKHKRCIQFLEKNELFNSSPHLLISEKKMMHLWREKTDHILSLGAQFLLLIGYLFCLNQATVISSIYWHTSVTLGLN